MSFTYLKPMPTPEEIKDAYPLSRQLRELKRNRDKIISDILTGKDDRFW